MSLILSLETSTTTCSVALHSQGQLQVLEEIHIPQTQATKLALLIEAALKNSGVDRTQLTAVAVTSGPGSYTGLRIGTSTAKGLCFGLNIPLIAVNTLALMAYQVNKYNPTKALLCPMIDARRMEVYCQVSDSFGNERMAVEAKVVDEKAFIEFAEEPIIFFGNGAMKCRGVIKHPDAFFLDQVYPSAAALGEIATKKFEAAQFEDLALFEPFYLKEFMVKKPAGL
jgi:tRNA threonylcarbamoyladenosine biosynthesis protein TsaB